MAVDPKIGTQNGTLRGKVDSKPAVPGWFSFDPHPGARSSPGKHMGK